jgi:membrane protein required for colicin V production
MIAFDWVFVAIVALLGIRCMIRGFVAEVLSVAAVLVGLLAALFLYRSAGQLFVAWGLSASPAMLPAILGFAAVFLAAFLCVKLIERLLEEGIEAASLGGIDRALGLVLGLAEGLLLVSLVLIAMSLVKPALGAIPGFSNLLENSFFARTLLPIVGPEVAKATQGINMRAPELMLQFKAPALKKP